MSKNIVFEGWLTKSPPSKRLWRTKWRRRWFALRQSMDLPGQYFLDYYSDRHRRRFKGTINLDLCEQVDAGLHMKRYGTATQDPKLRGSVFTIHTQSRTYHLEADSEAEMEKWVDAICRVCGLRSTENSSDALGTYQNNCNTITAINDQYDCTGPYIPISECITGVRDQHDSRRAFTFDPQNIVMGSRTPFDKVTDTRGHHMYTSQPHIQLNNADFSENESTMSDEECKSLNASQSNIHDWAVEKSFKKLQISPKRNASSEEGPPVPPRPPKTLCRREMPFRETRVQETIEVHGHQASWSRSPRRMTHGGAMALSSRAQVTPNTNQRHTDDEDDVSGHFSMQYCNLTSLPPFVDRALKPRHSSYQPSGIGHINHLHAPMLSISPKAVAKSNVLQYLDLDLQASKPTLYKPPDSKTSNKVELSHIKSRADLDHESAYKTVDFLKTEAFNITRQDAEASRSHHF